MLVQRPSLQQQQLEQVTALAVFHDQGLVSGILKDTVQLREALAHQAPHELDFPLHTQEVLGLHLGFIICLDDHSLFADGAQRFVDCGYAAASKHVHQELGSIGSSCAF